MILMSSTFNSLIQLLGAIIIFAFVLVITYFTTKWIGGWQKSQMTNNNLTIIETIRIANNQYVQIVKAGDTYLVLAVGKEQTTMLAELTEDQVKGMDGISETGSTKENFQDILNKFKDHFPKKQE